MNHIFFSNHENILSNHESMNAIYAFIYRVERRPPMGGRGKLFTEEQKKVLVKLVIANNAICLQEIQSHNIEINEIFPTIRTVSISTIDHVLHQLRMKQLHKVPFERNTAQCKGTEVPVCAGWYSSQYLYFNCVSTWWCFA